MPLGVCYIQSSLHSRRDAIDRCDIYMHRRGAFDVARFDEQGNARAFRMWNEQQGSAPRFLYMSFPITY